MPTIAETLTQAVTCHRSGQLPQAEQLYRQILQAQPNQPDAWHFLGVIAYQVGRYDQGIDYIRKALDLGLNTPDVHHNLAAIFRAQGRIDDAIGCCRRALAVNSNHVDSLRSLALFLEQQGKFQEAEPLCRRAIEVNPGSVAAHQTLGNILRGQQRFADALASYQEALRIDARHALTYFNLAAMLMDQHKFAEAEDCYKKILSFAPQSAEAYVNLGNAQKAQKKLPEAAASYREAIRLQPKIGEGYCNLGAVLLEQEKFDEAIPTLKQAIDINPNISETYNNLGAALRCQGELEGAIICCRRSLELDPRSAEAWNTLGATLSEQSKYEEATAAFQKAIDISPAYSKAITNLGMSLAKQGKLDEAIAYCQRALDINPDLVDGYTNLGGVLNAKGASEESLDNFRRAVNLKPADAETHLNLAIALSMARRFDEALDSLEQSLQCKPNFPEARQHRANIHLLRGNYEQGWIDYESRWECKKFEPRDWADKLWTGDDLAGRTILLRSEQGMGDTLQFIRYAPLVKQNNGKVIVRCPPALMPLLSRSQGVDEWVSNHKDVPIPDYDVTAPMMSLPGIFHSNDDTIPREIPYLFADPAQVAQWSDKLKTETGFKVGIVWQGNPKYRWDHQRSMPLKQFTPLAAVPNVRLFSLQKGTGTEQISEVKFTVTDLGSTLDETGGAFQETAAVLKNLDLVITSDTALAHLAGGLGVPVWVAVSYVPEWRWLLDRSDSPWYPTMRLFRQPRMNDWDTPFAEMAKELATLATPSKAAASAPNKKEKPAKMAEKPKKTAAAKKAKPLMAEVGMGELIDKITILQIKSEHITQPEKLANVRAELETLAATRDKACAPSAELDRLTAELKKVNDALWIIEDDIRACERDGDFGPKFIELARSVYFQNDRRAAFKRQINDLLGSRLIEEKSLPSYAGDAQKPGSLPSEKPFATPQKQPEKQAFSSTAAVSKPCRHGEMFYFPTDAYIGRSFDLYGEFSEDEVRLFAKLVSPGDTVLDVGANIGAHTIPLAHQVGPTGKVYAFEPQRMSYYCLCANVIRNGLAQVYCHHAALGETSGTIAVPELDYAQRHNFGGVSLDDVSANGPTSTVPLMTLDSLGLTACRLIKIDVEGMEQRVLAGAVETIRRCRPFLYVEDDRRDKSHALHEFVRSLGYEIVLHTPSLFRPDNFRKNSTNIFGNIASLNILCRPKEVELSFRADEFQLKPVV